MRRMAPAGDGEHSVSSGGTSARRDRPGSAGAIDCRVRRGPGAGNPGWRRSLSEPDLNAVTSLVLRALPDASVIAFDDRLAILMVAGTEFAEGGTAEGELVGRPVSEAMPAERWEAYRPLFRAALAGRSSSIEIDAVDRIGRDRVEVEPLRDDSGKVVGGVCFTRDIRDREQLIEDLNQQRRLLDLAHDAVIVREPTRVRSPIGTARRRRSMATRPTRLVDGSRTSCWRRSSPNLSVSSTRRCATAAAGRASFASAQGR